MTSCSSTPFCGERVGKDVEGRKYYGILDEHLERPLSWAGRWKQGPVRLRGSGTYAMSEHVLVAAPPLRQARPDNDGDNLYFANWRVIEESSDVLGVLSELCFPEGRPAVDWSCEEQVTEDGWFVYGCGSECVGGVVCGANTRALSVVACEGQFLRLFVLASGPRMQLAFFRVWLCIVSRLVDRTALLDGLQPAYDAYLEGVRGLAKGATEECQKKALEQQERELCRRALLSREGIRSSHLRAVFVEDYWEMAKHPCGISACCVDQLEEFGCCMHGSSEKAQQLRVEFSEMTARRYRRAAGKIMVVEDE